MAASLDPGELRIHEKLFDYCYGLLHFVSVRFAGQRP
jgi:hypothetical protein